MRAGKIMTAVVFLLLMLTIKVHPAFAQELFPTPGTPEPSPNFQPASPP